MLFASSAIIYFFLTMGSTESIEDFVISPHSLDHVSIKSACSELELRSYCSSVELELNKENEQHQEESPSQLKILFRKVFKTPALVLHVLHFL